MKYIRTKDKIYARDYLKVDLGGSLCSSVSFGHAIDCVSKKDIIKQADTIKELCDKFLVIETSGEIVIRTSWKNFGAAKSWFKNHCELFPSNQYELYGSIWVGVNLHAIAKMNEQGELELL